MPRTNPIDQVDLDVASRLRELRADVQLSRELLAEKSTIGTQVIARVELGRMPLRYIDGKRLLSAFADSIGSRRLYSVNPVWLTEGLDPRDVEWPMILPAWQYLNMPPNVSFSKVVCKYRDLILDLVRSPSTTLLPPEWIPSYISHWKLLHHESLQITNRTHVVRRLIINSATALSSQSPATVGEAEKDWGWDEEYQKPKWLADQYRQAGVRPPWGDKILRSMGLAELKDQETNFDECLTEVNKSETLQSVTMQTLLSRVRRITAVRGMSAKLALDLGVSPSNVSQWLSGSREPSGQTTLALLSWVEQWERKQKNR